MAHGLHLDEVCGMMNLDKFMKYQCYNSTNFASITPKFFLLPCEMYAYERHAYEMAYGGGQFQVSTTSIIHYMPAHDELYGSVSLII
jgi:hypothetical protein